jgi:hypothetical protein
MSRPSATKHGRDMDKHERLIRPIREILLPLAVLLVFATCVRLVRTAFFPIVHAHSWQSAKPADITQDPQYRILMENAQVRVFALTLPPGAQSFVRHEHNYLTVQIEGHEAIMWKNDDSPIQHFRAPLGEIHFFLGGSAHGIRNDSNTEFRNVTVEFLDPEVTVYGYRFESGTYDFGPNVLNPPVDPEAHFVNALDLEKAVARDIQLLPGESLPAAKRPALLIAITTLNLTTGPDRILSLKPGEVTWRDSNELALVNKSPGRARFALVEFKGANESY